MDLHDPDRVKSFFAGKSVRRIRARDPLVEEYENRQLEAFLKANKKSMSEGQNGNTTEGFTNQENEPG